MSKSYRQLNNLFSSDEAIQEIKSLIESNELINQPKKIRDKYAGFIIQSDHLYYEPMDLTVIPESEKASVLKNVYHDLSVSLGKGQKQLYQYIQTKYINISRDDVANFLKAQPEYQMTAPITHRVNKPIVASYPNELWCMDLLDMSQYANIKDNKNYNYILTCIDTYSGFLWLEKLKKKTVAEVKQALTRIFTIADIKPKAILSDNGLEFNLDKFAKDNDIKLRHTRSHSPQANGLVENANNQVPKKIRQLFVRNNNLIWINHLNEVAASKNSDYNRVLKATPDELWNSSYTAQTEDAHKNRVKQVKDDIAKFKEHEFEAGDYVRIKMSSLYTNLRKLTKAHLGKNIIVTYTPEIFKVFKVIHKRNKGLERDEYLIMDLNDDVIVLNGVPKRFYASDLLKSSLDSKTELTNDDALFELNRVEDNRNDVI